MLLRWVMSKLAALKNLLVPAVINSAKPNLPVPASARPSIQIVEKRVYPELDHVRARMLGRVDQTIQDLEVFCTVYECLNEGLYDDRLETLEGTMGCLKECRDYHTLLRRPATIVVNGSKVFFEV